jgi:hypothetical protein
MKATDTQRWQKTSPYLDRVLDLPPRERDAYLLALWAEDPEIAADVEALLAEHRLLSAEGFLDSVAAIQGSEPACGSPSEATAASRDRRHSSC